MQRLVIDSRGFYRCASCHDYAEKFDTRKGVVILCATCLHVECYSPDEWTYAISAENALRIATSATIFPGHWTRPASPPH